MEYLGVGFVGKECKRHKDLMEAKLRSLEKEAYALAGREFSLTSAMETGTAPQPQPTPFHFFSLRGPVFLF
jgi:DNA polymerase I-like protein with 3'-5' exonuclease and polymerase domains